MATNRSSFPLFPSSGTVAVDVHARYLSTLGSNFLLRYVIVWYMRKNNRDFTPCVPLQMDYEDTFLAEWSLESLFADIDNYSSLDLVRAWSNEVHFLLLYHGLYVIFIVLDVV
ncbi:hypothetical protein RHGRI_030816 [Rhododendron griersonianum]|uniref:Uncharacterized protein n=1 Tax=Rhododendron griersonianum TaxID=479676 RepID=A0AAV6I838_9ERIC|nr:hypothetical protein RHGRI_030816 [Rhododendron griersonianum]